MKFWGGLSHRDDQPKVDQPSGCCSFIPELNFMTNQREQGSVRMTYLKIGALKRSLFCDSVRFRNGYVRKRPSRIPSSLGHRMAMEVIMVT